MGKISFSDFQKLDLVVGEIIDVKDHPNANKLYILMIDVGNKIKQSCAGLKEFYSAEELKGKKVVVVNNLEEAVLRGEKSECMILAADGISDGNGISIIIPEKDMPNGTKVR